MSNQKAPVFFNDGCVRRADYAYISGKLKSVNHDEFDHSRLFYYKAPQWGRQDLNWNVVSVCCWPEPDSLHALSEHGDVQFAQAKPFTERIADVEKFGAVSQIRAIAGKLYVCGMHGQVYRRDGENLWVHIDRGILQPETPVKGGLHLNGIDGVAPNDIYVVGHAGRILHYDGSTWTSLASPTNLHLERVHCAAPGETYACGNNGTFLKITPQGIENHSIELADHFWGLSSFQGKVYLATLKGLYVFDGKTLDELDTGLEAAIGGYRLDARDGQLWSFGVDDLAYFDGKTWTRVIHPDNV